jgi:glycosyltransferase involved in cell wall biosynthesis
MTSGHGITDEYKGANDLCSIVIPVFNVEDFISATIESIRNQTYTFWECILVDDGCTDNTIRLVEGIIRGDPRFRIFKRPPGKPKGPSASRNAGFGQCSGEFVQFFDSDDLMDPGHLEAKLSLLKSDSSLDFVVCQSASFVNNVGNIVYEWKSIFSDHPFEDHACAKINFLIHGPVFRKSFLKKQKNLFNETIRYNEEWEFFSRMLLANPHFLPVNEILVYYRINPGGSTKSLYASENNLIQLINGYYTGFKSFEEAGKMTQRIRKFLIRRYIPVIAKSMKLKYKRAFMLSLQHIFETDLLYGLFELALMPFRFLLRKARRRNCPELQV